MSILGSVKNINKSQLVEIGGGSPSAGAEAPEAAQSDFERIFDAVKKRLSGQADAAANGKDLPAGALFIVPISPAINVLTPGKVEISDDVIRTYARQQGLNPAVLGALLGHGLPGAAAGENGQVLNVVAAPGSLPAPPALQAVAAGPQDSSASVILAGTIDEIPAEKLSRRAFDPGLIEVLRAAKKEPAESRTAGQLVSPLGSASSAVGAAEVMAVGAWRSPGSVFVPSPVPRTEHGDITAIELARVPAASAVDRPSAAFSGNWQGISEAADSVGLAHAVTQLTSEQSLQQAIQVRQTVPQVASAVAFQLGQSLKFERANAMQANVACLAAKETEERATSGVAEPQAPTAMVWLEEVDLTHLMPEGSAKPVADAVSPATSSGNSEQANTNEEGWRQERAQQDFQYQKLSEQMMESVGRRITDQVAKGTWQMSFQLRPARLGKIDVSLGMVGGSIDAAFSSAQAETRQLLDSGLTRLKEVLQGAGFEVGNLQTGGQATGNRGERQPQSGRRENDPQTQGVIAAAGGGIESNATEQRRRLAADGVDLIV
jgi:flagellar hook-length control protein FliK